MQKQNVQLLKNGLKPHPNSNIQFKLKCKINYFNNFN